SGRRGEPGGTARRRQHRGDQQAARGGRVGRELEADAVAAVYLAAVLGQREARLAAGGQNGPWCGKLLEHHPGTDRGAARDELPSRSLPRRTRLPAARGVIVVHSRTLLSSTRGEDPADRLSLLAGQSRPLVTRPSCGSCDAPIEEYRLSRLFGRSAGWVRSL